MCYDVPRRNSKKPPGHQLCKRDAVFVVKRNDPRPVEVMFEVARAKCFPFVHKRNVNAIVQNIKKVKKKQSKAQHPEKFVKINFGLN